MRKLSRDFSLVIAALLVGSVLTFGAGQFGLARLDQSFESVVSADMPRLMTITDLRRQIRVLVVGENDHILETDPEKAKAIAKTIDTGFKTIQELYAKYQPYVLPNDTDDFAALQADVAGWQALHAQVRALSEARDVAAASKLAKTHSKKWEALIKTLIANADKELKAKTAATRSVSATARIVQLAVFVISALLGLIAGLFIYRGIRRMVGEIVTLKDRLVAANEGLERTVDERTRTIRAILDHVQFGFFLVGRDLLVTDGYTRSLSALLGKDDLAGMRVGEALGFSGDRGADFDFRVEQIFDDILPEALNCDQVPSRTLRDGRMLRIQASAIRDAHNHVVQVLFGISDVTELEAAEKSNRHNQTLLRALRDPDPFRRFVSDLNNRFGSMRDAVESSDEQRARRELHTIKGNASVYGMTDLARRAHEVEEHDKIEMPPVIDLERELQGFLDSSKDILGIQRDHASREVYKIDSDELAHLEKLVRSTSDADAMRRAVLERLELVKWSPAGRLLGPLDAQVFNLAQRLGKDVSLNVVGGDIRVLPPSVMPIVAVLPHLLRNALDHGIESPSERGEKPEKGSLQVEFKDTGDTWQIAVRDDGRGIDIDRLHEKAVELGVIPAGEKLDRSELFNLVFTPKLSTAAEVSDVSGRGEGMGAVAEAVKSVDGQVSVRSRRGLGTTILIQIPKPGAPLHS